MRDSGWKMTILAFNKENQTKGFENFATFLIEQKCYVLFLTSQINFQPVQHFLINRATEVQQMLRKIKKQA